MGKNISINIRVNSEIKEEAEAVLSSMGLTLSETFNMLLHQINLKKALPFNVDTQTKQDYVLDDLKYILRDEIVKYELGKESTQIFNNWEDAKEWLDAED